jgi:hypothetical protein
MSLRLLREVPLLAYYGLAMSLHQALPDNVHSSDVSDSAFRQ